MADDGGEPETLTRRWFGLMPPKTDRSEAGFVKAIRAALADLGGVDFVSIEAMCDAVEEAVRTRLRAQRHTVTVWWVGMRRTNRHARLVVTTDWGLREDVECMMAFQLFGEPAKANAPAVKQGR